MAKQTTAQKDEAARLQAEREALAADRAALEKAKAEWDQTTSDFKNRIAAVEEQLANQTPADRGSIEKQSQDLVQYFRDLASGRTEATGPRASGKKITVKRGEYIGYFPYKGGTGKFKGAWFKVSEGEQCSPDMPMMGVFNGEWDPDRRLWRNLEYDESIGLVHHVSYSNYRQWRAGESATIGDGQPAPEPKHGRPSSLVYPNSEEHMVGSIQRPDHQLV